MNYKDHVTYETHAMQCRTRVLLHRRAVTFVSSIPSRLPACKAFTKVNLVTLPVNAAGADGKNTHGRRKIEMFCRVQQLSHQMTLPAGEKGVLGVTCTVGVTGRNPDGGAGARRGLPNAGPASESSDATPRRDAAAFSFRMAILTMHS